MSKIEKKFIEILNDIVSYNCLEEPLLDLKNDIIKETKETYSKFNDNLELKFKNFDDSQFEIFWMMLVLQFGDYGTSPRTGWLYTKNKKQIIKFIDDITKLSLEGKYE